MLTRLQLLSGRRRGLLLFAVGGLLGWFQAPHNFWWLSFICFPALLVLIAPLKGWPAFRAGWLFGFGYFLFGLYWIAHALFVNIAQFWWALPLAVAGLPMVLALYPALVVLCAQKLARPGLSQVLVFAALWGVAEWLRGHLFTGFPWLLYGYVWNAVEPVRLLNAALGAYGVTFVVILLACLPAVFFTARRQLGSAGLMFIISAVSIGVWGSYWSAQTPAAGETVTVRLVQPNVPQNLKLDEASRLANFNQLLELMRDAPAQSVIIWPETATGYPLEQRANLRQSIAQLMPPDSLLLTGVIRYERGSSGEPRLFNSFMAMNSQAEVIATYDKAHLVPFGEYIPFRQWLPFDPIAGGLEFSSGPGPRSLTLDKWPPLSPLICYEVIFPGAVIDRSAPPRWLVNVTNDAWYGDTHGPYQHWEIARIRAVEQGMTLVRVANNGITGVVDLYGAVVTELPRNQLIAKDVTVMLRVLPTPYSRYGDTIFLLLAAFALITGVGLRFNNR
jgi:apolipoprotein N-acyltransferase